MNQAITNALQSKQKTIINDVRMTDRTDMGSPVIEIQKRGQPYCDYMTIAELKRLGKPSYVSENRLYKNIYFCANNVPAEVVEILK